MENRSNRLSAAFVRTVKRPGRYGDGRGSWGLQLRVHQTATGGTSKNWIQQLVIDDKVTQLGLGSYPLVTLASAREKALENARAVKEGRDPRIRDKKIPTFRSAAHIVIAFRSEQWRDGKTAKRWLATLETYAFPKLGAKLVSEITSADVMAVLTPIWTEKPETARKVRERIGNVMKWAVAQEYRAYNPAGDAITAALPRNGGRGDHHRALPYTMVGAAIEQVSRTDASVATKLAFEFLTLTATRSGEVRLASWSEVDFATATWTIPATRMKRGLEHRVPLSMQAIAVLRRAQELEDVTGLIFPSIRGKALTDNALSKLLRENDIGCVPHGMRSSFRDWAAECTDVPREIAEHALAHIVGSKSEVAYRRTDYLDRRRSLMQEWADYVLP